MRTMHELSEFLHLCYCVLLFLSKTNLPLKSLRRFLNNAKIKLEVKILAENSRRFVLIEKQPSENVCRMLSTLSL
jgi:hypothetical protein